MVGPELARVRVPLGGSLIVEPRGAAFTLGALFGFFRAALTLLRGLRQPGRDLALGLGIVVLGFGAAVQAYRAVSGRRCGLLVFPRAFRMFLRELTLARRITAT